MKSRFEWFLFVLSGVGVLFTLSQMLRAWTVRQPPMLSRDELENMAWFYYAVTSIFALYITQKWLKVAGDFLQSRKTLKR